MVEARRRPFLACTLLLALFTASPRTQAPANAEDPVATSLARFERLNEAGQRAVLQRVERRLRLDPDARVQAIQELGPPPQQVSLAKATPFHDPAVWAKGVAPARKRITSASPAHRQLRAIVPPAVFLPELHKEVWYDWQRGDLARRATPLTARERFENLLHGFVPGSDAAVAEFLRLSDIDYDMRQLGAYFGHLYADLQARVFEGVTLYEVWLQEERLDVPDVDAIPFAEGILRSKAFRSPIPAGAERDGLYASIQSAALRYRKYRTLREAVAAAFVTRAGTVQPGYELLLPRGHLLLALVGNNAERAARALNGVGDREELLRLLDDQLLAGSDEQKQKAYLLREERMQAFAEIENKVRALAIAELAKAEKRDAAQGGRESEPGARRR